MGPETLTARELAVALQPLVLMASAPDLNEPLYDFLLGIFRSEGVTSEELRAAVVEAVKSETFWPGPAVLFKHIRAEREVRERRMRIAESDAEAKRRSSSRRLLKLIEEHDAVLFDRVSSQMGDGRLAQEVIRAIGATDEVKALLRKHGVEFETRQPQAAEAEA